MTTLKDYLRRLLDGLLKKLGFRQHTPPPVKKRITVEDLLKEVKTMPAEKIMYSPEYWSQVGKTVDKITEILAKEASRGVQGVKKDQLQLACFGVVLEFVIQLDNDMFEEVNDVLNER